MSWRDIIRVHPADAFPVLSETELRALGEDIKANGLRQPIACGGLPRRRFWMAEVVLTQWSLLVCRRAIRSV